MSQADQSPRPPQKDPHTALVEARRPLVKQHHVPLEWITGLNPADLNRLLAGILVAEENCVEWREWIKDYSHARTVLTEVIPGLLGDAGPVAEA